MNYCFRNANNFHGDQHTTWKVVFNDGTIFYIDNGWLTGNDGHISSEDKVPKEYTITKDLTR